MTAAQCVSPVKVHTEGKSSGTISIVANLRLPDTDLVSEVRQDWALLIDVGSIHAILHRPDSRDSPPSTCASLLSQPGSASLALLMLHT